MNTHTHNKSQLKKQLIRFLLATLITAALIGLLSAMAFGHLRFKDAPDTGTARSV